VRACFDRAGEHLADGIKRLDVGHRVGTRRAADGTLVHQQHVVDLAVAHDLVKGVGVRRLLAFAAAQGAVQGLLHEGALARAADARHQTEHPQRKIDIQVLQVVAARPPQANPAPIRGAPVFRSGDASPTGQVLAGETGARRQQLLRRSLKDDFAAAFARPRTEFDNLVRAPQHGRLVFRDDDRVAAVLQAGNRIREPVDVARVQAHRRLVQHVQHVDQIGAQRRGHGDTLRLAAAERPDGAIQGQVAEPHVAQVPQARFDLFQHHPGHRPFGVRQDQRTEEIRRVDDFQAADLRQIAIAHPRRQGLGAQPFAAAGRARPVASPSREERADGHLVLVPFQPVEEPAQAAEVPFGDALADDPQVLLAQLVKRHVDGQAIIAGQREQLVQFVRVGRRIPGSDRALAQRLEGVRHHQVHVHFYGVAEAFALRASAQRAVVVEQAGLRYGIIPTAVLATQGGAESHPPPQASIDLTQARPARRLAVRQHPRLTTASALSEGGFQRIAQTRQTDAAGRQSVGNHQQSGLAGFRRAGRQRFLGQRDQSIAGNGSHEPLGLQLGGNGGQLLLRKNAPWKGQQVPRALRQFRQTLRCALRRLTLNLAATPQAKDAADLGEQQAEVIDRLRSRRNRGSTGPCRALAGDRDGGRQTVDAIGLRLLQPLQKLPRVGGEALDVPPLPFGVQGVQRQTGLAAAAHSAEHDQPPARQVEIDGLQVMDADAAQLDTVGRQGSTFPSYREFSASPQ